MKVAYIGPKPSKVFQGIKFAKVAEVPDKLGMRIINDYPRVFALAVEKDKKVPKKEAAENTEDALQEENASVPDQPAKKVGRPPKSE